MWLERVGLDDSDMLDLAFAFTSIEGPANGAIPPVVYRLCTLLRQRLPDLLVEAVKLYEEQSKRRVA